eukprot:6214136-Pleurochrysis_carterae.AAC.2
MLAMQLAVFARLGDAWRSSLICACDLTRPRSSVLRVDVLQAKQLEELNAQLAEAEQVAVAREVWMKVREKEAGEAEAATVMAAICRRYVHRMAAICTQDVERTSRMHIVSVMEFGKRARVEHARLLACARVRCATRAAGRVCAWRARRSVLKRGLRSECAGSYARVASAGRAVMVVHRAALALALAHSLSVALLLTFSLSLTHSLSSPSLPLRRSARGLRPSPRETPWRSSSRRAHTVFH